MERFSKKRQAIIDCLKNTKTHPTAEWIYNELKPKFKDLSLATVYRNLKELKQSGDILSVGTILNKERFDGTVLPHSHAICSKCGKVFDVENIELDSETKKRIQKKYKFKIDYSNIHYVGICKECENRLKEKNNKGDI
ncbi:MAG: transcriptional repressor [Clostridia bacterium]|nr:transcriptional repressor [Clostridia bacterium]